LQSVHRSFRGVSLCGVPWRVGVGRDFLDVNLAVVTVSPLVVASFEPLVGGESKIGSTYKVASFSHKPRALMVNNS
jgi:hypothetical protein